MGLVGYARLRGYENDLPINLEITFPPDEIEIYYCGESFSLDLSKIAPDAPPIAEN